VGHFRELRTDLTGVSPAPLLLPGKESLTSTANCLFGFMAHVCVVTSGMDKLQYFDDT